MARTPFTWDDANFTYDLKSSGYTWDDIALVEEALPPPAERETDEEGNVIIRGRAFNDEYVHPLFQDENKKKRLIKLIYKTQGKVLKEEKEIKEIKVTVKDVKILAKEVLGINVKIL